jgi:hypothetical protein
MADDLRVLKLAGREGDFAKVRMSLGGMKEMKLKAWCLW